MNGFELSLTCLVGLAGFIGWMFGYRTAQWRYKQKTAEGSGGQEG